MTTRISEEERLTIKGIKPYFSSNTNSTRNRASRGRAPHDADKLSCLHLLLRAKSFASWPLQVRFFCRDAYDLWVRWSERVHGEIPAGIRVSLDLQNDTEATNQHDGLQNAQTKLISKSQAVFKGGIEGVVVGYSTLKDHVEKSLLILAEGQVNRCGICAKDMATQASTILVCPQRNCQAIFHMTCLATRFLEAEKRGLSVIPRAGTCPHCRSELQWIDLVKEMSLRVRGKSELARLTKKRKMPETRAQKEDLFLPYSEELNQDASERPMHYDAFDSPSDYEEPLPRNWDYQDHDEDGESLVDNFVFDNSMFNSISKIGTGTSSISRSEIEIQDSELDDTEILDFTNGDLSYPLERN